MFAQWIDPANLALLERARPHARAVLAFTGLRVSSVVTLLRDALERGSDGHPYLRYFNVKAKPRGDAADPAAARRAAQSPGGATGRALPGSTEWLLPSRRLRRGDGKGGAFHISPSTVQRMSSATCAGPRSAPPTGKLALDVHPHLFRHHVGTSMVNDNIPLTVIQKVLDHGSIEMTARYARLHDETVKQRGQRWHERVNIRGERIALPVDGPLERRRG